ncbi:site-specific integrase [bacterium]|nr:site-specific integrase [bacterium]
MAHIAPYPGGRYRAVVRKAGFKTRSGIFPSHKAAYNWATKIEREIDHHTYKDPSKFAKDSIGSLFERFRDEVVPGRKGARWDKVRINMLLREADFVKRRTLEMMPKDIRDWRDVRLNQVSPQSVNREMNLISKIFTYAIKEWDYPWKTNPMREVGRPAGAAGKPRNRRWSDDELQAILTAAKFDPERAPVTGMDYVPWGLLLIIETAMRPNEFCSAKVADVHIKQRFIRLHDSKNGDARDVPLSSKAIKIVATLVKDKNPTDTLFPISSQTLSNYYRVLRKQAGLADANLRFYDGKHEAISRMAPKFRDAVELSKVTGHRDLKSLSVYYNPKVEELADKLG